jgi:DNA-binding transcriptional LysR family regulator
MRKSFHQLDLNLLIILQLLLQNRSVTKVASRLAVTPSSVSKSLGKLRQWFNDPLFLKTPTGLQPTALVIGMESELAEWSQIANQLSEKTSNAIPTGLNFRLMMESPLYLLVLSQLPNQIHQQFPDSNVQIYNWDYDSIEAIIGGNADIGLCGRENHPRSPENLSSLPYYIDYEILFEDRPVVYLRRDHPALNEEWNLEAFLKYRHIGILWEKKSQWILDDVLANQGLFRDIGLSLSNFEQALSFTSQAGQNMFTIAPSYCKKYISGIHPNLVSIPLPLNEEMYQQITIPLTLLWHKRNSHTEKFKWLKQEIKKSFEGYMGVQQA